MGAFKAGQKRSPNAGRKKGTPNKSTQDLLEKARRLGVDPFEILLLFARGDWKRLGYDARTVTMYTATGVPYEVDVIEPPLRVKASAEAAQYLYAKRKAVEISGAEGGPIQTECVVDLNGLSNDELRAIQKVMAGGKGKASGNP